MKTQVIAALTALTLSMSGGAAGYAQTADSAGLAAQTPSDLAAAKPAASAEDGKTYEWTFTGQYEDAASGRSYYRAYAYDKQSGFMGRVIYKNGQGDWSALPDRYLYTSWDISAGQPVLVDSEDVSGIQHLFYDPSTDTVVRRAAFNRTGNEAYGLLQTKTAALPRNVNGNVMTTAHSLLMLKNYGSGEIRVIGESGHSFFTAWLNDGSLLVERYSEEAKQNEIVKLDPASGKTARLLLASVWGYNEAAKQLMIAYNEPNRKLWIYNLGDGTLHPASKQEIDSFYGSSSSVSYPEVPADQPPSGLQPQLLPVTPTEDTTVHEAEIAVNGKNVKLPFAFQSGGSTYVPVRPLADASVCAVKQTKTADSSYFTLTGPSGSVKIPSEESAMLGYRLYVSTEQLKSVGLMTESLTWTNRG